MSRMVLIATLLAVGCGKKPEVAESPAPASEPKPTSPQEKKKVEPQPQPVDKFPLVVTVRRYTGTPLPKGVVDEEDKFDEPIKDVKARRERGKADPSGGREHHIILDAANLPGDTLTKGSTIKADSWDRPYRLREDAKKVDGAFDCNVGP